MEHRLSSRKGLTPFGYAWVTVEITYHRTMNMRSFQTDWNSLVGIRARNIWKGSRRWLEQEKFKKGKQKETDAGGLWILGASMLKLMLLPFGAGLAVLEHIGGR